MNITDYLNFTRTVSIYPEAGTGSRIAVTYAKLGLMDELGECCGKWKKLCRDGNFDPDTYNPQGIPFKEALMDEIGDVFFYIMRCADELKLDYFRIFYWDTVVNYSNHLKSPELIDVIEKIFPALDSAIKWITTGNDTHLGEVVVVLTHVAQKICNADIIDIINRNTKKLTSRKQRGTIKGDGDNR